MSANVGAVATGDEAAAFGDSVSDWPAFPDSAAALVRLKERFRLIILSNVDRVSFARSNEKLGVAFDLVITAEDVGSYKPDHRNFERLLADLASIGIQRSELVHVAESLYHDHAPAQQLGLPSVWIHRRAGKEGTGATHPPDGAVEPAWRFTSMADFADAALGWPSSAMPRAATRPRL
jgi:2-haloalkanoic acid dehalogenase type II